MRAGPPLLSLYVDGVARPEGSKVPVPPRTPGGRWVVIDDNGKVLRPWRKAVTTAARLTIATLPGPARFPLSGPVWARCDFTFERPGSHSAGSWPTGEGAVGDLDKLVRAVYDALTDALAWGDDAQVVQEASSKRYGPRPGVRILVGQMTR